MQHVCYWHLVDKRIMSQQRKIGDRLQLKKAPEESQKLEEGEAINEPSKKGKFQLLYFNQSTRENVFCAENLYETFVSKMIRKISKYRVFPKL